MRWWRTFQTTGRTYLICLRFIPILTSNPYLIFPSEALNGLNTPVLINIFPLSARNFWKDTKNNFKDYWWANIILRALLRCIESFCSLRRCCIQAGESVGTRFHACSLVQECTPAVVYGALWLPSCVNNAHWSLWLKRDFKLAGTKRRKRFCPFVFRLYF